MLFIVIYFGGVAAWRRGGVAAWQAAKIDRKH
jgi:hypothetical protein